MALRIYNTLTRKKETLKTIRPNQIGMYVCGPTIYDFGHLGHGRSAINFDVIRRYFIYKGYKVKFVFNYTDIDDKIINRARERNISWTDLTKEMARVYDEDYEKLGILKPDVNPYATHYINEMLEVVERMDKNGFLYKIDDDGIYFDVSKVKGYGKLSRMKLDEQKSVRKELTDKKKNPQDFVVWKFKKAGEPFWQSKYGEGRPGWHLECTAMIWKNLGIPFDIHGGGADLIMPHHEDEIAQGYGAFGDDYARYWMHNGFINVNNEKMSKSLGNFFTLRDIFKKYDPKVVRFFVLQTHYRMPCNFADILLDQAKSSLERINRFVENVYNANGIHYNISDKIEKAAAGFEKSMDDDFDTSGALASIYEFIKEINTLIDQGKIDDANKKEIISFLKRIDSVFNVMNFDIKKIEIPDEIKKIAEEREKARKVKDWEKSDRLRNEIKEKGYEIIDGKDGYIIRKVVN